ncbi:CMGC family protein kinase [Trichomonas vaginalis G3]|uniref:CMGC family protein kinase n=1 Tax=Trichomonas vaginalis (strain ATCC PRA-98 / G3) TaxID=412133 RepID=A2E2T7_TRIV3|nr:protein kinase protein [Trichomonas vaginalis G3]EAY12992.1 CMGC family protein kinase [Trichomonas vaginalis G3]KAI5503130.1 protein kinase protein [Trichomonas vaginalis G3]|eukprot:XP_001325215.1 CMGC family protein kinase [Trichomonas vaginalis G3]
MFAQDNLTFVRKQKFSIHRASSAITIFNNAHAFVRDSISFHNPISPELANKKYPTCISEQDKLNILNYKEIYYLHNNSNTNEIIEDNGYIFFNFNKANHIVFRYEQIELCGRGSFGTVLKCFDHKEKTYVAIKIIANSEEYNSLAEREVRFLETLSTNKETQSETHIIELIDTFSDSKFTYIVTKFYKQNLYDYIKSKFVAGIPFRDIRHIAKSVAKAMQLIHSCGIIHSDLKPENIMLEGTNPYIIDFGCSSFDDECTSDTVQGLYYRAPEVIFNNGYNSSIDVWSFGCLLFELITGTPLFESKNETDLIRQITKVLGDPSQELINSSKKMKRYWFRKQIHVDNDESQKNSFLGEFLGNTNTEIISVISACLKWDPNERPTFNELLEYPFFN